MLDARSQQIASAPHDAVHRVPLFQKQLAQIGAVLTGDSGNQRDFVGILHTSRVSLATFALCFLERKKTSQLRCAVCARQKENATNQIGDVINKPGHVSELRLRNRGITPTKILVVVLCAV